MKKILLIALGLFVVDVSSQDYLNLIAEGSHTVEYISEVAELHFDSIGKVRGTGYKPFKRWQYFAERAMDETGKLKTPEFYYNELQNYNEKINTEGLAFKTTVGAWEEMGPTYWDATTGWNPGVGRITSIAVQQDNLNHIIVGGETGGVWKSMDGGVSWNVLTDNLSNIDVYALAIDPSNSMTYFWGSTDGSIFKSTDGGATWGLLSNVPGGRVNKILIDPTNPLKMYVSAQGSGLYKSTNGGASWGSIYFTSTGTGYDLEFKPSDPNTIYASGNEFYISTDGGTSFNQVNNPAPNNFVGEPKMIGVSANNPNIVYVVEAVNGIFGGLYVSTDSGSSFVKRNHDGSNFFGYDTNANDALGQAPRDMDITVNPNNADDVHIAGINTWRSVDGGINFNITSQWVPSFANTLDIGYCHADVDIMHFAGTGIEAKLFVGTDGGIFKADDPSNVNSNYYTDLTPGLGIRQFYKIGVSQTDPVVVTGGSQDNGTSVLREDGNWTDWLGADGMEGFVDKNDLSIMYGTAQFGILFKTQYGLFENNLLDIIQPDGKGGQFNWNWIVPFEQDPITPNTIYCAFDEVYRSDNRGNSWSSISQNFIADIDHFKVAPTNNQIMYLAIDGNFWYTNNGGSFIPSVLNLNGGWINDIAVHPTDPLKVAIATTNNQKVYISTDGGVTWTSIQWDLPNFSAQALVWQDNGKDGLYLGMNYGVYYTDNDLGNTWIPFNNGLPNVRINELEINTADNRIYAATYGRGLWRSNIYNESLSTNDLELNDFSIYPNPVNNEVNLKWNQPEDVTVRVYDALGKIVFYGKKVNLQNGFKINISALDAGYYFVKLNTAQGEITKKLILN